MRRRIAALTLLVAALAPAPSSHALWDDRLELIGTESLTYDDNVFRLADDIDPTTALGAGSTGDLYRTSSVGFDLDIPLSAQRFVADLTLSKHRFDRFSALDLDAHQGRAELLWQIGDRTAGRLGFAERLTLASLANVQGGLRSTVPNFLTVRHTLVNANYGLARHWRIGAELRRLEQSNSAPEYQLSDISADVASLTLVHVTPATTQLGVTTELMEGHLPNRQVLSGFLIDNSFRQRTTAVFVDWPATDHSRLSARTGPISRHHLQLPLRDFEGWMFHAAYEWQPTDRVTLALAGEKDISDTEEVNVGFVLRKSASLYSHVKLTDKTDASISLEYSDREYLGHAELALGASRSQSERLFLAGLKLAYRPTRILTFELALRHISRSAAAVFNSYDADIASFGIRVAI